MTDDDTYTGDENLDAVLMTAPDTGYCRICGGDIQSDGVHWSHVEGWIVDHAPELLLS